MRVEDTVIDVDKYLEEMGWVISRDGMEYAWLKQALNRQAIATFKTGKKEGIGLYAWWKDGVQYVGSTGKTLAKALKEVEDERK